MQRMNSSACSSKLYPATLLPLETYSPAGFSDALAPARSRG